MADYDVIVIGGGLGGLSAGALSAKNGFKTLILEQADIIGGCCSTFEMEGYKFDVGASIVEFTLPIEAIFERMGRKREDYIDLIPCDPIYSFITEDGRRFSYPTDIEETTKVIESFAPEDVEGWKRFAAKGMDTVKRGMDSIMLAPMGTISESLAAMKKYPSFAKSFPTFMRTHQGVVRSYYKNPTMLGSVSFQSYFVGAPPELGSGIFGLIAFFEHLGIYYPRGGMMAIPEGIRTAGEEFGLEVQTGKKVDRILVENGTAFGVMLEDGTEITGKAIVSNLNAKVTYFKLIGPEYLKRWASKAVASYEQSMPCPMIYVGLDKKPDLDAHHTMVSTSIEVLNDVWNNYYKKNIIPKSGMGLVCWPTEADPSLAPEGHHILNFLCNAPAPYAPLGDNWDRLKPFYKEEAIDQLEKNVMPDIRDHLKIIEVSTPLDFERRLLQPEGCIYGLFSDFTSLAMFRPRGRSKAIKNLYLAGSSTHLGGGVPVVIPSGMIASDYILKDHG